MGFVAELVKRRRSTTLADLQRLATEAEAKVETLEKISKNGDGENKS